MEEKNKPGKVSISCKGNLAAGSHTQLNIRVKPGFELAPRTKLQVVLFTRFFSNQWSLPQTHDPTAPGFTTACRSDRGFIRLEISRIPSVYFRHGSTFHVIEATVGETTLEDNGHVDITFGFQGGGSPGAKIPPLAKEYFFPVYISQRHVLGSSRFMEDELIPFDFLFARNKNVSYDLVKESAVYCPAVVVEGGEPANLKLTASMRDDRVRITANILDGFGNISPRISTEVMVDERHGINIQNGCGVKYIDYVPKGVERFRGDCKELGLYTLSNPIGSDYPVAFGEIHCHSSLSDGLGSDTDNYLSAIKSGLDFGALSDHDTLLEKDKTLWNKTIENADNYLDEPDFITLLGYEALTYNEGKTSGHVNIYYPGNDGKMYPRPQLMDIPGICRENKAVSIPHHTMYGGQFFGQMGLRLDLMEPDEFPVEIMPLVEIYSTHGNSENAGCERSVLGVNPETSVKAALDKGFRWGFIGGSDNHESLLGHNFRVDKIPRTINNEHMQFRHGLTAAYVDGYSRKDIFNAMKERSVYATTGEKILLSFSVNDAPMGNEITVKDKNEPRTITVFAAGTGKIERIDIIRNGETITRRDPETMDCEIIFIDEDELVKNTYYYIKVVQKDGEMAWSSPVWVDMDE